MSVPGLVVLPARVEGSYERDVKRLQKHYPAAGADLAAACQALAGFPDRPPYQPPQIALVPGFGRDLLKIRVASSDQNKGKSGGFRLLLLRDKAGWRPVAAYAKVHEENLPAHEILKRLRLEDQAANEAEASAVAEADPEVASQQEPPSNPGPEAA